MATGAHAPLSPRRPPLCREYRPYSLGITIDTGIYDRVRAFRAPNSRHPKTGRHKRRLTLEELTGLSLDGILQLASKPEPFDVPTPTPTNDQAQADWREAESAIHATAEVMAQRRGRDDGASTLNRSTLEFIRDGAEQGDRHRLLFSAAANLMEFGCPPTLAHALLTESGLDSGLAPSEVRRQIECGLTHKGNDAPAPSPSVPSATPQAERAVINLGAIEFQVANKGAGPYGAEGGRL